MIYVRSRKVVLISRNHLQRDTQRVLFPLTLTQYLTISPKYCIRYNFITPNGFITNVFIVIYTTIVVLIYSYTFFIYIKTFPLPINSLLICIFISQHLLFCICFASNAAVTISQSQSNVELLISLQTIRNNIQVNETVDRRVQFGNWAYIAILVFFYIANSCVQITAGYSSYLTIIIIVAIDLPLEVNIMYAARIIKLLKEEISCWISELKLTCNDATITEQDVQNARWSAILNAYVAIIEAYSICQKVIGISVVYYVFMTFLQCIMNVQILIEFSAVNMVLVLCILWSAKSTFLLSALSYECEYIYITLKNAQVACMTIPRQEFWSDNVRTVWKKLRLEGKKKLLPLNASGVLVINANLPLQLLSTLVTYTIVLLQFNFL